MQKSQGWSLRKLSPFVESVETRGAFALGAGLRRARASDSSSEVLIIALLEYFGLDFALPLPFLIGGWGWREGEVEWLTEIGPSFRGPLHCFGGALSLDPLSALFHLEPPLSSAEECHFSKIGGARPLVGLCTEICGCLRVDLGLKALLPDWRSMKTSFDLSTTQTSVEAVEKIFRLHVTTSNRDRKTDQFV